MLAANLDTARDTIKEKIQMINQSLAKIDYNRGTFIALDAQPTLDADIRNSRPN